MTSPQLSRLVDPNELQLRGVTPFIVTHLRALFTWQTAFNQLQTFDMYIQGGKNFQLYKITIKWQTPFNQLALDVLMNAFVHLYLAFYVILISLKTLYLSITFVLIYILEAWCTHTGHPYCTRYCIVFFTLLLNNYFNYLFNFISWPIYLFLLPTYLLFYLYPIIALVVFLSIVLLYF